MMKIEIRHLKSLENKLRDLETKATDVNILRSEIQDQPIRSKIIIF